MAKTVLVSFMIVARVNWYKIQAEMSIEYLEIE